MKLKRIIAGFLAVTLLILTFSGCAKAPEPDHEEAPEPVIEGPGLDDLVETDSLVIYIMKDYESIEMQRINQFTALYDVDVEVVRVDGDIYAFTERIMNDLAGGSGPDVLIFNESFTMDITKAAMNGNFLDLTDILAEDPEFSKDNYLDGVFEACQVNGRQYTVPTSYRVPLAISSKEQLEKLGFDWSKVDTMSDFLEELARLTPVATQELGFTYVLCSKNEFRRLFRSSGISLVNYETGEVLPDEQELRKFLEAYKAYFPYDYEEGGRTRSLTYDEYMLSSGILVFFVPDKIQSVTNTLNCMKLDSCDYVLQANPGQVGEVVGSIAEQMAISANAKNSLNAYKFIKYMLSEENQADNFTISYMPVHKEVLYKGIHNAHALYKNNGVLFEDEEKLAFSEEEASTIEATITGVDQFVQIIPRNLVDMVLENMLPFFRDEASYDDCLADLKNKLTLYLSE